MARKIRFPLKMKNEAEVRTLEELQQNFDLESVLGYFADGKLQTWLADRYYEQQATAVAGLSADEPDLNAKICEILGVEYQSEEDETDLELIQRRNEKRKILNSITDDKHILDNVDLVAMDQDELFDILDEDTETVYLYGESFSIPFGKSNVKYIGICKPRVVLEKGKNVNDYSSAQIRFENVQLPEQIIQNESKPSSASQNSVMPSLEMPSLEIPSSVSNPIDESKRFAAMFSNHSINSEQEFLNTVEEMIKQEKEQEAFKLAVSEADRGNVHLLFLTGKMFKNRFNYSLAVECFQIAADKGYAPAENEIGECYFHGKMGFGENQEAAIEWFQKSAEHGYAQGQYTLGILYQNGYIDVSRAEAMKTALYWFRQASDQNHAAAQYMIGNIYLNGYAGIEQDTELAISFYIKSARNGYWGAQWILNRLGLQ